MTRQSRQETREASGRKRRVPLGTPKSKLSVPHRKGYVRRWINDTTGRLRQAEEAGYQFVEDESLQVGDASESGNSDVGSRVSRIVGKQEDGSPLRAYLMEIKEEWYREDQAEKKRVVDETDKAIREGRIGDNQENRYIPKGGITVK